MMSDQKMIGFHNLHINLTILTILISYFLQPTGSHFVILHWAIHSYKI